MTEQQWNTVPSRPAPEAATPPARRRVLNRRFALHYAEMVASMFAGMLVFGGLWSSGLALFGRPEVLARDDVGSLVMATTMSAGMAVWMRYRRHGWGPIAEMCAAMYASFAILFPPLWAGLMDGGTVMMLGHVLMFPAMLAVMLRRPEEYSHRH
ncbi:hypothetical protein [Actinomadura kijaniata]|uniref:hypothetical protein n=1 Tax=Actinomadura kijaniata TaxID=46161 RepID=UPI000AB476A5|nr:hypothetical protein [Actinomadura kijaniata]